MDFKMHLKIKRGQSQRNEGQDIIKTDQIGFKRLKYYWNYSMCTICYIRKVKAIIRLIHNELL